MGHSQDLPLTGLRVLDLTQALAGPFATMLLGDMGAEVIKIETPRGEPTRTTPPHFVDGQSLYFLSVNRNKKGMVLDLKAPKGLEVFFDLVRKADVVIYNFSHGVVQRLGIDADSLHAVNPSVITCNITGFGTRGPDAAKKAVDVVIQAMGGGISITGEEGRIPVRSGIPTADLSAGMFAVMGILAALVRRRNGGLGGSVETSLFHSQLSLLTYVGAFALFAGQNPRRVGSGHLGTVPSQVFSTSDGLIAIEAGFDHHFSLLCEALGMPHLVLDRRFSTRVERNKHRNELLPILETELGRRTSAEWLEALERLGVPSGPVNGVLEALSSAQSEAYHFVKDLPVGEGSVKVVGSPIFFGDRTDYPVAPAPRFGEHSASVLIELLGYGEDRVHELMESGAVR